jgi:hypothetical protein
VSDAVKDKVLFQYDILDGLTRETHHWIIPGDTPVSSIIEHVDNSPTIVRESVRLYGVTETEEL